MGAAEFGNKMFLTKFGSLRMNKILDLCRLIRLPVGSFITECFYFIIFKFLSFGFGSENKKYVH